MTSPVLTLTRGESASDALAQMRDAHVRHAVVVSGRDIVGVVSERDLGGPRGALVRKGRTVEDEMHQPVVLGRPDMPITRAALLLREKGIGCLPIVEATRLVGIVTRGDLLEALAQGRRAERRGRVEVDVPARPPLVISPNRDKSP